MVRIVEPLKPSTGSDVVDYFKTFKSDGLAVEEQRHEEQKMEEQDIVFPTHETLLCFKVKVGAMLLPLSLSFFYFF